MLQFNISIFKSISREGQAGSRLHMFAGARARTHTHTHTHTRSFSGRLLRRELHLPLGDTPTLQPKGCANPLFSPSIENEGLSMGRMQTKRWEWECRGTGHPTQGTVVERGLESTKFWAVRCRGRGWMETRLGSQAWSWGFNQ